MSVVRGERTRASRSERTRRALIEAALKRYVDQGLAATTVTQIVSDVGVTERTFHRYFVNKEQILFDDYEEHIGNFHVALQLRPRDEPLAVSVRYAVEALPGNRRLVTDAWARSAAQISTEKLEMHLERIHARLAREIECYLKATTYTDPADALKATIIASMLAAAVSAAQTHWRRSGYGPLDKFRAILREALAAADKGITATMEQSGVGNDLQPLGYNEGFRWL